jgi:DNA-binding LacI/PurR family transcriptional regulator
MSQPEFVAPRRPGIIDVAARAGVSRQTVTRAMNDMAGISDVTKQRVLDAARELHYRPSRFGRGLSTRVNSTLGLIVVDLTNSFWAELASRILDAASRRGWTVLIAESAHGGGSVVSGLVAQVDAVIGHLELDDARIEEVFGPLPLVLFGREPRPASRALITLDFGAAIDAAIEHLASAGRRSIVMLDWSLTDQPSRRGTQFVDTMRARGLEPRVLHTQTDGDPNLDSGRVAADEARRRWPHTDAFVCFNDVVAVGVMKQLAVREVAVPDDVAVVGMDGLPLGVVVTPELTTLEFDFKAVADLAVELVHEIAAGRAPLRGHDVHRSVAPELTVRRSS